MLENQIIDKENNINHTNVVFRRRKKSSKDEQRPLTSILETTFNPLPKLYQCSIPLVPKSRNTEKTIDHDNDTLNAYQDFVSKPTHKQGPIIARSHKLK
jgi:hypothetical protein